MKLSRPSPSLVVSFVALSVALGGTGYAAATIGTAQLKSNAVTSGKIKNNSVTSNDIKNGTIFTKDLSKGVQNSLKKGGGTGPTATGFSTEAVRQLGPINVGGNAGSGVATLKLGAGAYVVQAKTTITTSLPETDLLSGLAGKNGSAGANCRLTTGGAVDRADANVVVNNRPTPSSMVMQQTVTLGGDGTAVVDCAAAVAWTASNTSIIATKVPSVTRQDVNE